MKGAGELRLYVTIAAAAGHNWAVTGVPATRGVLSELSRASVELALELESTSGRILEDELRRETPGDAHFWVEGRSLSELQAGRPPLISGAVIVATPPNGSPPHRPRPTGLELTFSVLSGPDTGSMQVLKRGTYSIGRTTEDIHIADPQLSRLHAELTVEPTSIRIKDRGSANGTGIDRRKIESSPITTASQIEMGSSICGLRFSAEFEDVSAPMVDPSGPLLVHREPATQRRAVMLLMALLPVAIGVGLALVTGLWMFLAFSAMSALTMLIPVVGGRKRRSKFKKELEAANQADTDRRKSATPSVAEILRYTFHQTLQAQSVNNRPTAGLRSSANGIVLAGWIRLGVADQVANVSPDPPDRDFVPSLLHSLPVSLNLGGRRHISITGNREQVLAMVRSLVIQVSSWNIDSRQRLMFYGPMAELPLEARFLPDTELLQAPDELRSALKTAAGEQTVLFLARTRAITEDLELLLREETGAGRLTVIGYGGEEPQGDVPTVTLVYGSAILKNIGPVLEFVPDLVQPRAFERYCRNAGKLDRGPGAEAEKRKSSVLPKVKALDSLVNTGEGQIRETWESSDNSTGLEGPIGVGTTGDVSVDLQRDGPHLLVAGTTGSGKSELLRTLILSLGLSHSPRRVNFLLIDFKGGSGLGPLRKLPHSVGLLTDLSAESVERAMASLRAEVRRRESLFAQVEAGDIASYRRMRGPELEEVPSLVIVIDEFRMLLEEVPAAMDELLRIASLGRSLGLHLIMATQRPQGAISADIRANITTSISLRVQTAMESQDILETSEAAGISIESPGRAYLKQSGEPARQFQSASSSRMSRLNDPVRMCPLEDFLADNTCFAMNQDLENGEAALKGYIRSVANAWSAEDRPQPRQPVLPDLPEYLDFSTAGDHPKDASRGSTAGTSRELRLGLLDLPSLQQQSVLRWRPRHDAHLALVGGPRSGVNGTMRNIVAQLLACRISLLHLYVLDGDGVLPGLEGDVQVGAYVSGDDIRRATRVIQRVAETVSERLAAAEAPPRRPEAVDGDPGGSPSPEPPTLVLAVTGWGRWLSAIRNSPWPWAEETMQDLVRDGGKVGVTVVVGGDRELATARMFGNIENRLFLPTGASAESLMAWPRLPVMKRTSGRAFVEGRIALRPGVVQLIECSESDWAMRSPCVDRDIDGGPLPFRIDALPRILRPADLPDAAAGPDDILVGVQGDQLEPAVVRLTPGSVYIVLGSARSGKTATLEMLVQQGAAGGDWLRTSAESLEDESSGRTSSGHRAHPPWAKPENLPTTLLVDDADRLSPQAQQKLVQLHSEGCGVIMSATLGPSVMSRIPLASAARAAGRGMVLMPRTAFDGEFFGIRLDPAPAPPPGRAAIIEGGRWQETQLVKLPTEQGNV